MGREGLEYIFFDKIENKMIKDFSIKLIQWYNQNKRDLPWRNINDPYLIWLSEVILQQTRVAQGLPYYLKFAEYYPTIIDLAEAEQQEVLRLWQGLGYYSRARNMHATAKLIVDEYNGIFPDNYNDLLKLKGIGPYTAAAIASFAFKEKVAVVDGNVFRVLSRLFGIETDISSHEAKKEFSQLANELISEKQPDTFNQALMEFGATFCTPANPQCMFCIFQENCIARLHGKQAILPVKSKKVKVKERFFNYFLIEFNGNFLMRQRQTNDIWEGLFDFYLIENDKLINIDEVEDRQIINVLRNGTVHYYSENQKHILTHQRIEARFIHVEINSEIEFGENFKYYSINEIDKLPKPILIEKFLKKYLK
jgi:A/G-specific adenine glycosylase